MKTPRKTYYFEDAITQRELPGVAGWLFRLGMACCLFASLCVVAGLLIIGSPTLTRSLSAIILKPQAGATQWNGADRITVAMLGLTQRTTEPARTDTLLLMDVDPSHRVIHMLSVPSRVLN